MLRDWEQPGHSCSPGCKCHINSGRIKEAKQPRTKRLRNNSKAQEREIAKSYKEAGFEKARRVPGSGAFSTLPGDIDPQELLLAEAKETRTGKLTLNPDWVDKIENQARQMGRPWWAVHLWVAEDQSRYRKNVVISEEFFFSLLRRIKELENEMSSQGLL